MLKRPPSLHEGLLEHMSDTANNRTATSSYSGIEGILLSHLSSFMHLWKMRGLCIQSGGGRREAGGNKGAEASFSEMLKKSNNSMKKVAESSDASEGGGKGKKKGKKGRQMDPALLGFKVASNRILMGEIHRADDF